MQTIGLVILSYGRPELLAGVLNAASGQPFSEIVVSDNLSSKSAEIRQLVSKYPKVRLMAHSTNLGYSGGFNEAAKTLKTPWLLLAVDDIILAPDFGKCLEAGIQENPNSDLFAFVLKNADGSMNYCGGFQSVRSWYQLNLRPKTEKQDVPTRINYATGACMAIRRELFNSLGGFDPNFFLYYEDADLSLRAEKKGSIVQLLPQCQAVHTGPMVSGLSERVEKIKKRSFYLMHFKHASFAELSIFILRLIVQGVFLNPIGWEWIPQLPFLIKARQAYVRE